MLNEACNNNNNFLNAMMNLEQASHSLIDWAAAPSVYYRPKLFVDGDKWCALYGDNLQDGVSGFGDSPAEAMASFDKNWFARLKAENES